MIDHLSPSRDSSQLLSSSLLLVTKILLLNKITGVYISPLHTKLNVTGTQKVCVCLFFKLILVASQILSGI